MNNKQTIIFSTKILEFQKNKIFDKDFSKQYPGAGWLPILKELAIKNDFNIVTCDVALDSKINIKNSYLIQDLNTKNGKKLLKKGAKGVCLISLESPLFSYYFYDNFNKISKNFKNYFCFSGIIDFESKNPEKVFFPSFSVNDEQLLSPWEGRKFSVMVAANKTGFSPLPEGLKNQVNWLIHRIYKLISPSFKKAQKNQLHSKRIEIIKYFGSKGKLRLFGNRWLDKKFISPNQRKELYPILKKLNPSFVDNKHQAMKDYKFAFCFENTQYEGYVTEKIIDCFIAGVIPVYMGARNIESFIPKNCFIDYRDFEDLRELESYLDVFSKKEALIVISNFKKFLKSSQGKKFSHEEFANKIFKSIVNFYD